MYEIGYAEGLGKGIILLWRTGSQPIPALLKGLRYVEYSTKVELAMKLFFGLGGTQTDLYRWHPPQYPGIFVGMVDERILIVDADREVAASIRALLRFEGYLVDVAGCWAEAEALLSKTLYDVALLDLCPSDASGVDVLARCREIDPAIAVLILTAYGTVDTVAKAFKLGAKDFLAKPVRREELLAAVERALDTSQLTREARSLRERFKTTLSFQAIVGRNAKLRQALDLASKVAASNIPALICGETGTGKEMVAAAIHAASPGAARPMVTAMIADNPREMQRSELFGHVRGAFTGAVSSHRGLFQMA